VIVSHQLPVWITRLHVEGRPFLHNPRHRQCTLCSLTSLTFDDDSLTTVRYSEPAADLIPVKDRRATFSSGGTAAVPDQTPTDQTPPA
jgi:broad specificity phosphatase PhoE